MYNFNKTEILGKVVQNRTSNRAPVRTLTGRIGGYKKGSKMAVCMEKCILFYWCWSQRLICSTLEPTFFILLKQTAAMIFFEFFFFGNLKSGGRGGPSPRIPWFVQPHSTPSGAHNPNGFSNTVYCTFSFDDDSYKWSCADITRTCILEIKRRYTHGSFWSNHGSLRWW